MQRWVALVVLSACFLNAVPEAASMRVGTGVGQLDIDSPAPAAGSSMVSALNQALYNPDLVEMPQPRGPVTNATKLAAKKKIFYDQLHQVKKCFPILFNATIPVVLDRTNFPKYKSRAWRFRYHCQQTNQPKNFYTVLEPTFLASYNIDGFYLPEWVAFVIRRPVYGVSFVKGHTRKSCLDKGGGRFFPVRTNNILTPDAAFTMHYNLHVLESGRDVRESIQKGQLCLPTNFLTCPEKEGTYAMTNIVPMNKYLYTVNLLEADKAIRRYVAENVDVPDPRDPLRNLVSSTKYNTVYMVAGPHFPVAKCDWFDWVYAQEDIDSLHDVKRAPIPHAIWYAVLDPEKLENEPESATLAWYCNNRPKGPWPPKGDNMYDNGPKLCRVMNLHQLEMIAGVNPFPTLPKAVRTAKAKPAVWHLAERF